MSMSINQNLHRHIDMNVGVTQALPAAGAAANSTTIDLRSGTGSAGVPVAGSQTAVYLGNSALQDMQVLFQLPSCPNLVEAKAVTIKLQDSADDSSYADVTGLGSQTITGATGGGTGGVVTNLYWSLPPGVRRYLQCNVSVPADAGTLTAVSYTLALVS